MAVTATDSHFVISVPRLMGYKTLILNGVMIAFSVISVVWPKVHTPDPQALDILFNQGTAAAVAVFAFVNALMRLQSTGPAAPFKPAKDEDAKAKVDAVVLGSGKIVPAVSEPASAMGIASLALATALAPRTWPMVDGVEHDEQCNLRVGMPCSCHAHYPSEVSVGEALADQHQVERVFPGSDLTLTEKLNVVGSIQAGGAPLRAFIAAFLVPSMLLFGGVAIATLPGCASVTEISAVAQAETTQQRAFALYGTFVVLEERAADMIADRSIPKTVRQRIQQLDKITKPAADLVFDLASQLNTARRTLGAPGGATSDKVAALATQLSGAINTLAPRVSALVAAVEGARA